MNVLIVVDIQNDFLPGGSLAVKDGNGIIPLVNKLIDHFSYVMATRDWHPTGHGSFASSYPGKKPGEKIDLNGLPQILWPDHCVQHTRGAEFSAQLDSKKFKKIFTKGTDPAIDSYSGFYDNGHRKSTGLSACLKNLKAGEVTIVGLATDYCVKFTALDAVAEGFKTTLVPDATRAVNLQPDDFDKAVREMADAGVIITGSVGILS